MPQLLLELLSEDIPARMQAGAARDLERLAVEALREADLPFESLKTFCGLRRLVLVVDGLPTAQADRVEERKGPRVGAPDAAMEGFLRSSGARREDLEDRGGLWFARIDRPGRPTAEIIAETVPALMRAFPWPKAMTSASGILRWVRPLRGILCVFDRRIVPFAVDGIAAGDLSEGHRFIAPTEAFRARDFDEYREALAGHHVILDPEDRKRRIEQGAQALCAARGLTLVADPGLLAEVAGMTEWPVPLLGRMDPDFLSLPPEVVRTSMRVHQRYFAVAEESGALVPYFIVVANIAPDDGGTLIAAGATRVLTARLNDARFFFEEDRKAPLEARLETLAGVTFHARIGTMRERSNRLEALARALAPLTGADPESAALAGRLAKADLATAMVGEFPELQGIMGGYYAAAEGLPVEVGAAIRDHYRPQGLADPAPTAPVTIAVALADKLDLLVSFFAIGETPTGSRDPFALRRATLGVIRILLDNRLRVALPDLLAAAGAAPGTEAATTLLAFFRDRLAVRLRETGARPDIIEAVFALGDGDIVRTVARIAALEASLASPDGTNLLAGVRRAGNILAAERAKAPWSEGLPERRAGTPAEELALYDALAAAGPNVRAALEAEDFAAAAGGLAALRGPVDAFFEAVLVNSEIPAERENRLRLLAQVCAETGRMADFSKING